MKDIFGIIWYKNNMKKNENRKHLWAKQKSKRDLFHIISLIIIIIIIIGDIMKVELDRCVGNRMAHEGTLEPSRVSTVAISARVVGTSIIWTGRTAHLNVAKRQPNLSTLSQWDVKSNRTRN